MNILFIFTVLVVGSSGIVAQVLLLRELLVSFNGNELIVGVILANWVLAEAIGVFIVGKLIDRIKNKINAFIGLEIIFSLILPLSIYLARTFKHALRIPFAEATGLLTIFYVSSLIILPVSFCHGALFSASCKINSLFTKESVKSIGNVYTWETIGTIIGGVFFTYLLIPYLNSFQIAFIIAIVNLVICLSILRCLPNKKVKYLIASILIAILIASCIGAPGYLQRNSLSKQWKIGDILDYRNSIYGNIAVVKKGEQTSFLHNGISVITTPYPDITFVEEFGNLPLLFHSHPQDILVISSGAGGLINEALKHPITKIDYAELDPLIIKLLKEYPSSLTKKELSDSRLNIINLDGRFFLKNTPNRYDVILLGLSSQSDLSTNRLFTREFFILTQTKLNPDGILALRLSGSLTYLSKELKDLNACILNALKNTFKYVRVIPGDYNIILSSDSENIMKINPSIITERITERNIKVNILTLPYLNYRFDKKWVEWFNDSLVGATEKMNLDFSPFAVFKTLVLWNKQFSLKFSQLLQSFENLNLKTIFVFVFLITLVFFYVFRKRSDYPRLNIAYSIFTTGFFGMLINLILIFSFQIFYGYLYYAIGLLISIFMAGVALGSITMTHKLTKIKNDLNLLRSIEASIILFSLFAAIFITKFINILRQPVTLFIFLLIIAGFLIGLEFPLASKIYLREKEKIGETAGLLYFADLSGGWLAGMLGGIIFLPILGLFNTCIVLALFKLSSFVLLLKTPFT